MDLGPFKNINPCGFEKLEVAQIADFYPAEEHLLQAVSKRLTDALLNGLGYQAHYEKSGQESLNRALNKQLSNPSKSRIASDAIFTQVKMEYL
jgi:lipoate-protein ligase B